MKELKSLIWLEWKKSSALVNSVFIILFLILALFSFGDLDLRFESLIILSLLFLSSYLVGLILLMFINFNIGKDLKTDEFIFLLMSPVKPWKHISSRVIFSVGLLAIYFLFVALIPATFIHNYWVGNTKSYIEIISLLFIEHLTLIIVPLISFALLSSMVIASFKKKSQRIAQIIMGLFFFFAMFLGMPKIIDLNGTIIPEINIELNNTLALNPKVIENFKEHGDMELKIQSQRPGTYGGSIPILIEPQIIILLISLLSLAGAVQIWKEIEL